MQVVYKNKLRLLSNNPTGVHPTHSVRFWKLEGSTWAGSCLQGVDLPRTEGSLRTDPGFSIARILTSRTGGQLRSSHAVELPGSSQSRSSRPTVCLSRGPRRQTGTPHSSPRLVHMPRQAPRTIFLRACVATPTRTPAGLITTPIE
jgi:hypothetical protein